MESTNGGKAGTRKPRRRGSVTLLPDGRWLIRVSLGVQNGRRVRQRLLVRGKKADAERALTHLLRRIDDGLPLGLGKETVSDWVNTWLASYRQDVSPRSRADDEDLMRRYLPVEIRAKRLTALAVADVQSWVNSLSLHLSPRTVRLAHGTLRACLNQAVRNGLLVRNVVSLVSLPKLSHRETKALSREELTQLLNAVEHSQFRGLFFVLALTGVRPGEAIALKWADFDGKTLQIRRAAQWVRGKLIGLGPTKTGRPRAIPLPELAQRALSQHRLAQVERRLALGASYEDQDLIFSNERGGVLDWHNFVSRHFYPACRSVNLPKIRPYDLRHTHATLFLEAGEHPKVVQERLGHSTITLTLDTYSHVLPGLQEQASQRLDQLLNAVVG